MHSLRDKDDPRGNSLQPRADNIIDYHVPLTVEDELFGTPTSGQSGSVTGYVFAGLNREETLEYKRILGLEVGEVSQEEFDYFHFLNKRVLDELLDRCS